MGQRGPDPKVSDDRILLEFLLNADPALFTSEIAENVEMTPQRLSERLQGLSDEERALLKAKKVSNRNLYWLTDAGRQRVVDVARRQLGAD